MYCIPFESHFSLHLSFLPRGTICTWRICAQGNSLWTQDLRAQLSMNGPFMHWGVPLILWLTRTQWGAEISNSRKAHPKGKTKGNGWIFYFSYCHCCCGGCFLTHKCHILIHNMVSFSLGSQAYLRKRKTKNSSYFRALWEGLTLCGLLQERPSPKVQEESLHSQGECNSLLPKAGAQSLIWKKQSSSWSHAVHQYDWQSAIPINGLIYI